MKTIQIIKEVLEEKPFSVKEIFKDNWNSYLLVNKVRGVELKEVEKMLSCKGLERGCFVYSCPNCGKDLVIPFGCNSRICSCCGKRHTDKWAERLMKKIIRGLIYRHLTFSIPEILWSYFKEKRELQKVLMDVASVTIKEMFSHSLRQEVIPGIIIVLHPFGKDIVFKPHVHALATEGGYNSLLSTIISLPSSINHEMSNSEFGLNSRRRKVLFSIVWQNFLSLSENSIKFYGIFSS